MDQQNEQQYVLVEIRDILREQLAEYRKVTKQSLEYQQQSVRRQAELGRLYKFVIGFTLVLAMLLIWYLSKLPVQW